MDFTSEIVWRNYLLSFILLKGKEQCGFKEEHGYVNLAILTFY